MSKFLSFVEIRTKIASQLPFLFGTAYAAAHWDDLDWINTLLFFLSVLLFDMTPRRSTRDRHSSASRTDRAHYTPGLTAPDPVDAGGRVGLRDCARAPTGPVVLLTGLRLFCGRFTLHSRSAAALPPSGRRAVFRPFHGTWCSRFSPSHQRPGGRTGHDFIFGGVLASDLRCRPSAVGIACVPAMRASPVSSWANNIADLPADRAVGAIPPAFHRPRAPRSLFAGCKWCLSFSFPSWRCWRTAFLGVVCRSRGARRRNVRHLCAIPRKATFPLCVVNLVWMMVPVIAELLLVR
jgi:hypothetical protein